MLFRFVARQCVKCKLSVYDQIEESCKHLRKLVKIWFFHVKWTKAGHDPSQILM